MLEIFALVLNIFVSGFLAFEAFRQKERADRLQSLNREVLDTNDKLIGINEELMVSAQQMTNMVIDAYGNCSEAKAAELVLQRSEDIILQPLIQRGVHSLGGGEFLAVD